MLFLWESNLNTDDKGLRDFRGFRDCQTQPSNFIFVSDDLEGNKILHPRPKLNAYVILCCSCWVAGPC